MVLYNIPLKMSMSKSEKEACIEFSRIHDSLLEVQIPGIGRMDIVTPGYLIEVKTFRGWKGALGQVLAYGANYKGGRHGLELVVALYGLKSSFDITLVKQTLERFGVKLARIDHGILTFL